MVVDPGGSTGVTLHSWDDTGTTAERLASRINLGSETLTGHWTAQGEALAARWRLFKHEMEESRGIPCYLVVEDFILTKFKSSDRTGLYPVWIAGCLYGHLATTRQRFIWQMPSAMTFATDERLKDWGLWVKGRVHERAANRHFAFFVADKKAQNVRNARVRTHTDPP
jgi:hypothetical protein